MDAGWMMLSFPQQHAVKRFHPSTKFKRTLRITKGLRWVGFFYGTHQMKLKKV
jgi:hypothetical protein